MISIVFVAI